MRTLLSFILPSLFLFACVGQSTGEPPSGLTKDDARAMGGKFDQADLCESFGWYGDGECDEFCSEPDPDCASECRATVDCAPIYCVRAPCPTSVCTDGRCVIDNPEDDCDAGERECPLCGGATSCVPHGLSCPVLSCPPPGDVCGGTAGGSCGGAGQFCDYGGGCGVGGGPGNCRDVPDFCTREIDEVCGCDGVTYNNACDAQSRGVSVDHSSACEEPMPRDETCGGLIGHVCSSSGQFCDYRADSACGAGDRTGSCRDIPMSCTLEIDEVCGCDGVTYNNACAAWSRGVSVSHSSACEEPGPVP